MPEHFVQGPDGHYNLRFVRRIDLRYNKAATDNTCQAELDDGRKVALYDAGMPENLTFTAIPGDGHARVFFCNWGEALEPEAVTQEHLVWSRTRIIGWLIDLAHFKDEPLPILVDPPGSNGFYAIEEPNGNFVVPFECRLDNEGALKEWALEKARFHAGLGQTARQRRTREGEAPTP